MKRGYNKEDYKHLKWKLTTIDGLSSEEADARIAETKEWMKKQKDEKA